jgi:ketosteroid isomerase-like protein
MSRENVEIVRSIFESWGEGDFSSADWADPDIEFVAILDRIESRGIEAMRDRWLEVLGAYDNFSVVADEFLDVDDRVLVHVRFRGSGKSSGAPLTDFWGWNLFTLRDARVTRLVLYPDAEEAQARDAAGLSQ